MTNQGSSATSAAKETAPSPPQGVWIVARSRKAACAKSSSATPCNGPKPMLLHKNKHNKKKNANACKHGGPHGRYGEQHVQLFYTAMPKTETLVLHETLVSKAFEEEEEEEEEEEAPMCEEEN